MSGGPVCPDLPRPWRLGGARLLVSPAPEASLLGIQTTSPHGMMGMRAPHDLSTSLPHPRPRRPDELLVSPPHPITAAPSFHVLSPRSRASTLLSLHSLSVTRPQSFVLGIDPGAPTTSHCAPTHSLSRKGLRAFARAAPAQWKALAEDAQLSPATPLPATAVLGTVPRSPGHWARTLSHCTWGRRAHESLWSAFHQLINT